MKEMAQNRKIVQAYIRRWGEDRKTGPKQENCVITQLFESASSPKFISHQTSDLQGDSSLILRPWPTLRSWWNYSSKRSSWNLIFSKKSPRISPLYSGMRVRGQRRHPLPQQQRTLWRGRGRVEPILEVGVAWVGSLPKICFSHARVTLSHFPGMAHLNIINLETNSRVAVIRVDSYANCAGVMPDSETQNFLIGSTLGTGMT